MHIGFGRFDCNDLQRATAREWLLTNGLGGFAAGTVAGINTRRYHGLLIAAFNPPVERHALVSKLEKHVLYAGKEYALSSNEYADGTVHPRGFECIEYFALEHGRPCWRYAVADARIEERIRMVAGENATVVRITLLSAQEPLQLTLNPLCTYRDFHHHSRGGWPMHVEALTSACRITAFEGAHPFLLQCERAEFRARADWHWRFLHRVERERGLDAVEDLFSPGVFTAQLNEGESLEFVISAEKFIPQSRRVARHGATDDINVRAAHATSRSTGIGGSEADTGIAESIHWIDELSQVAADQFLVANRASRPAVIAGYPWFGDWGRDTMIALPGLAFAGDDVQEVRMSRSTRMCGSDDVQEVRMSRSTRMCGSDRLALGKSILESYAEHVSEGMLPNRFSEHGTAPDYNSVDASLWYFQAVYAYVMASNDFTCLIRLYPVLTDILNHYAQGTRYGIAQDPVDHLLRAGVPGVQLTWMDAKAGDWVVTPRIGKPVEVNALWYHAWWITSRFAQMLSHAKDEQRYEARAQAVAAGFQRFWNAQKGYLFDVLDCPGDDFIAAGQDARLRPNQLLAVSLTGALLSKSLQKAVVDSCARHLVTSYGLRTLAPFEKGYCGVYTGDQTQRDAAYHQGTVWPWLLGPFLQAHFRVYGDRQRAMSYLRPMQYHLSESGLGQISEVFDGDAPHQARGCIAQAWSVAEIIRLRAALSG